MVLLGALGQTTHRQRKWRWRRRVGSGVHSTKADREMEADRVREGRPGREDEKRSDDEERKCGRVWGRRESSTTPLSHRVKRRHENQQPRQDAQKQKER